MDAIRMKALTKFYGKTRGVEGLDLEVKKGEFFGFIGPNGAGKSTAIRTLLGFIKADAGRAEVHGKTVEEDREKILEMVGYMPSEAVFYPGMKVKEILKLSADLRKKDCKKEAERLAERLRLDLTKKAEELSFGNRKKVAIITALQHEPEVLILDEPTGGLDPLMQREFFDLLHERNKAGVTVFLSSHVLSEIRMHCDKAAIIREGRVIACDSVEALSKNGAKRVNITGQVDLSGLQGIKALGEKEDSVSFLYSGDINRLLGVLGKGKLHDITIAEPSMEEIFLHYYENGGGKR